MLRLGRLGQLIAQALRCVDIHQRVPAAVGQLMCTLWIPVEAADKLGMLLIDFLWFLSTLQIPNAVQDKKKDYSTS